MAQAAMTCHGVSELAATGVADAVVAALGVEVFEEPLTLDVRQSATFDAIMIRCATS